VDPATGAQTNLVESIRLLTPAPGQVLMVWLGQAGFLLKTPEGQLLLVDPYLSNEAERTHGLSRIVRAPIRADEITPDLLLVTHGHVDHLDPPTIRAYGGNGHTTLIAPPDVCAAAETRHGWGGACMPLPVGANATVGDLRVVATRTRHGDLTETESVGFLLRTDGLGLWHLGDTEYDARLHRDRVDDVDVVLIPINGSGGNMNASEAAVLACQLNAGLVVPMHFGMWSDDDYGYDGAEPWATPDPGLFTRALDRLSPTTPCHVPTLGTPVLLSRSGGTGHRTVVVTRGGA
jgi:L-ascorbate 6-phosphate lactonase